MVEILFGEKYFNLRLQSIKAPMGEINFDCTALIK